MDTVKDPKGVGDRLDLAAGPVVGRVTRVDADRLDVVIEDPAMVSGMTVSDLVAVPAGSGFLMGLVARVEREATGAVSVWLMPVGTFHAERGRVGEFRLGATEHPTIDAPCHLVDGERLRGFMTALGDDVAIDEQLVLGHYVADRQTPAIADANRLLQRHLSILGNTGAGKSWTVATVLERAARLPHANIVVLDLHGEYRPLTEPGPDGAPPIAFGMRIAGPADLVYAGEDVLHLPYWLLEREELMSFVINEQDPFVSDQRLCLADRVQTLKRSTLVELGAHEAISTATVDSPVPYRLDHLIEWLDRDEVERIIRQPTGRVDPGPFAGKLGGLISRLLARVGDPRYGFIFHPPEETQRPEWLAETAARLLQAGPGDTGIKVIDLSEVPAPVLPMVTGLLARLIYNVQFWMAAEHRTPVCLVCDEAHIYLPSATNISPTQRVALEAYEMIAKEGRKYGVCLAVVSQRPSDVSRTILSQCNNFIVMRLTNDEDQEVIAHLIPGALEGVSGMLPMLDVGEAMILGDALLLPVRIKLDPPSVAPASATLPFWSEWSSKPSNRAAIVDGVQALRFQWRGLDD